MWCEAVRPFRVVDPRLWRHIVHKCRYRSFEATSRRLSILRPAKMKIAVEGCCHGELDKIYGTLQYAEEVNGFKIDLLLICGDFQACRNEADLSTMACPVKYRDMQTFYKYYSGEKEAPILTIFIGGNHEASNHLWELPYGGWVAPNIYYLGYAGVVNVGGLRVAGVSGIYDQRHFPLGHYEKPPFHDKSELRSFYHVREYEIFQLKQLRKPVDVFLSHDWPSQMCQHGNLQHLLRKKPYFQADVEKGELGNPATNQLVTDLKPGFWFSAHLHVKYPAVVNHEDGSCTRFLALNKCLPGHDFLQILDFPEATDPPVLKYDEEWLSIVKSTFQLRSTSRSPQRLPGMSQNPNTQSNEERVDYSATEEEIVDIKERFSNLEVPKNFKAIVPVYRNSEGKLGTVGPHENPQTAEFCRSLDILNPCGDSSANFAAANIMKGFVAESAATADSAASGASTDAANKNNDEISISDDDDDDEDEEAAT